jgi:dienelactone hydrolase
VNDPEIKAIAGALCKPSGAGPFPAVVYMRDAGSTGRRPRKCRAITGKTDFEVVVYPGDSRAFTLPSEKPRDYLGRHVVNDEKATQDAEQRADAFMATRMK